MQNITLWCTAICLAATTHTWAQTTEKEVRREIQIEKKEKGKREKMTIVVDGDDVTINGKPAEEYKGKKRIVIGDDVIVDGNRVIVKGKVRGMNTPGRKALLGVFTANAPEGQGALVEGVNEGSAAEKAGLKEKDVITEVDGKVIKNSEELTEAIALHKPGDEVVIKFKRNGTVKSVKANLGSAPQVMEWSEYSGGDRRRGFVLPSMPDLPPFPRFELEDGNLSVITVPKVRYGMNVQDDEDGKGVLVTDVEAGANAAKAGMQKGDIITEVEGTLVKDVDSLKAALDAKKEQATIGVKLLRNGNPTTLELKVPRKLKSATL